MRRRVYVSKIPLDLQRLIWVSTGDEISVNDYVVGVLSRRYGHEWTPTGLRSRRHDVDDSIVLKLPEPLWAAVKQESVPYSTMSAVVIKALEEDG